MTDRLEEIRRTYRHATHPTPTDSWLNTCPHDVRFLLVELDVAEARLAACAQERDTQSKRADKNGEIAGRRGAALARAEEALRQIEAEEGWSDAKTACVRIFAVVRAYFTGEK